MLVAALVIIVSRGGSDDGSKEDEALVAGLNAGCGVTLADVQALLPANSGVTENRTDTLTHCNFTWNDNGPRHIDVTRLPGGRAQYEAQSTKVPSGPTNLKDGTPYESLAGLGERAWAYGVGGLTIVDVLRGADVLVIDLRIEGTRPEGPKSPTGMDSKSLEICQALAKVNLATPWPPPPPSAPSR